ncbi:MAG: phosphoribosylglycinamide formyltransferase 2, partial [Alcanivoracaceae bacterium]
ASASAVLLVEGESEQVTFAGLDQALTAPDTDLRLFGKPEVRGSRRMGVALARDTSVEEAVRKAKAVVAAITVTL